MLNVYFVYESLANSYEDKMNLDIGVNNLIILMLADMISVYQL